MFFEGNSITNYSSEKSRIVTEEDYSSNERSNYYDNDDINSPTSRWREVSSDDESLVSVHGKSVHDLIPNKQNQTVIPIKLTTRAIVKKIDRLDSSAEKRISLLRLLRIPSSKATRMIIQVLKKIDRKFDENYENGLIHYQKINIPADDIKHVLQSFLGNHRLKIELEEYLNTLQRHCPMNTIDLLALLIYLDRIIQNLYKYPLDKKPIYQFMASRFQHKQTCLSRIVNSCTVHRLILAGITVSSKFLSDFTYSNKRYAQASGLTLEELNYLEFQFLRLTNFNLSVSLNELEDYGTALCSCSQI
ncbi:cyclin family protein NDAI_0E04770 [Naumovozyma dairenensis CBS 421]|uniref:Cyclin n=1 Tax=Naumovozyma dairenensis (strain ATCC 10597 / BCRC 20456 / CBS 421 / NBRC 0211 / NRRL Y-12639) TaxID=1071378 RepID=G0WAM1_NAUDC|nr:hypothetical protein NDAI_0E04770 [Naumovozyma dairenensis CBS 421]CCD25294.1 hypothetical protein NDAI_0E04770 [Naumovozyma dairenensis CBS 421]